MSKEFSAIDTEYGASHGTLASYVIGFILSILLTLVAYVGVVRHLFDSQTLLTAIIGFGVAQLAVQLIFFLHLSKRSRARWNLTAFAFTSLVVLILVVGSLWIMGNLNDNMNASITLKNSSVETAY